MRPLYSAALALAIPSGLLTSATLMTSCGSVAAARSDAAGGGAGGGGGTGGAGTADGGGADAGGDAPMVDDGGGSTCAPSKPFGTPLLVPGLTMPGTNAGARFSPDELTVYFANLRAADAGGAGNYEIFTATRAQR